MDEPNKKPITDADVNSAKNMLDLLAAQLRTNRIDTDFMLRQVARVKQILEHMDEERKEQPDGGPFEMLFNISKILGSSLDLQIVLDQVMDAVVELTGAERGFLMLRDDDGNLHIHAARNLDKETISSEEMQYSRTITNRVLDSGEAIVTTDAADDPRFADNASVQSHMLRSIMCAPLWARGRVIGVAYVENRIITGLFSKQDLTMLQTMMGQAAIAIDNAMLFGERDEELARRVEELRLLRRIDMQLNEKLDPDAAMLYTLESACRITAATSGHLGLIKQDPECIEAIHHYDKTSSKNLPIYLDDVYPRAWEVVKTGETIIFDSGQYALHTVMILPVIRENKTIGVVVLKREDGGNFSEAQQELVERVVARAAVTIENARLYAAVSAANKAKSEFVGIVAHDLKAPMTSIGGYADLMLMNPGELQERQEKYVGRISSTVKRMEMLVQDLADISRIESGQFLMDELEVTVASVVEAASDTVMPQIQARRHTFIVDVQPDLPDMWTDYYRLVQVLMNLLTNATKYTPDEGTITLKVCQKEDRIHFIVSDTGIGLNPEGVANLGKKFWRAEDDFTRSQQGTGLGFSITSSLVEQMGSQIEIDSEPGKGSTFSFSVAIAKRHDAE